jgi:hypothetical protein
MITVLTGSKAVTHSWIVEAGSHVQAAANLPLVSNFAGTPFVTTVVRVD